LPPQREGEAAPQKGREGREGVAGGRRGEGKRGVGSGKGRQWMGWGRKGGGRRKEMTGWVHTSVNGRDQRKQQ